MVEPRLERAAEEGGPGGEGMAGFSGWRVRLSCLLSFPLCGNGLCKPLDSGLRRNDGFVWIPACAGQLWVTLATCYRLGFTTSVAYAKTYDYIFTTGGIAPTHADITSSGSMLLQGQRQGGPNSVKTSP